MQQTPNHCKEIINQVMYDFEYAGYWLDSNEIKIPKPQRNVVLPKEFEIGVKYIFYYNKSADNSLLFGKILPERFDSIGFITYDIPINVDGPVLGFRNTNCEGIIVARYNSSIANDPELKIHWSQWSYIIEFK